MSWGLYCAVFAVVLVGGTTQMSVGMGYGLVAAPVLRILEPDFLPGPIVAGGMLVSILLAAGNSERGDVKVMIPALVGRLFGIGAALVLLATLSERGLTVVIGGLVLTFVALRLVGLKIARTTRTLAGAGVASGVGGTIASLGGAPLGLLYSQHAQARDFRGPMGVYLSIGGVVTALLLIAAGEFDGRAFVLAASLLPPILTGWVMSRWLTPYVDRGFLQPIVLGLSAASASVLLITELT